MNIKLNSLTSDISAIILQKRIFISFLLPIDILPHKMWNWFVINLMTVETKRYDPMTKHPVGRMLVTIAKTDRLSTVK